MMKAKSSSEGVDLNHCTDGYYNQGEETYQPRTELGYKRIYIRAKIVAFGEPLLNWEEVTRKVAERRREA